jgi:UTP--glucose-1-phosphate uridylyltransferase
MNSFNTHSDTLKIVRKYKDLEGIVIEQFNQSKYPRISQDAMLPLLQDTTGNLDDWYPPGHGDLYPAFARAGLVDKYLAEGREWLFVSNIDNLAATVDWKILKHAVESNTDFIMEVTDKTRADIKGGTLIKYGDTPLRLLEIAQVPKEHVPDFTSIKKFKIFNTNNLWINLKALKEVLSDNLLDKVDIIPNPKVTGGVRVLQLETAAGAAIACFKKPLSINVPRSRFLPVKSTSDLFVVQSDLFSVNHGTLAMSNLRSFPSPPVVKLGNFFKNVSDYLNRLGGRPNLLELDQLTISGDVTLGRGVVLKGTVIIVATEGNRIDIPDGSILEDQVVTGSLRLTAH